MLILIPEKREFWFLILVNCAQDLPPFSDPQITKWNISFLE